MMHVSEKIFKQIAKAVPDEDLHVVSKDVQKDMTPTSDVVEEITTLHAEIEYLVTRSLHNAIRIGELLARRKEQLAHGDFTKWVEKHLPFTDRTARTYMRLWRYRDVIKTENVSVLTAASRLLKKAEREGERQENQQVPTPEAGQDPKMAGQPDRLEAAVNDMLNERIPVGSVWQVRNDKSSEVHICTKKSGALNHTEITVQSYKQHNVAVWDGVSVCELQPVGCRTIPPRKKAESQQDSFVDLFAKVP